MTNYDYVKKRKFLLILLTYSSIFVIKFQHLQFKNMLNFDLSHTDTLYSDCADSIRR